MKPVLKAPGLSARNPHILIRGSCLQALLSTSICAPTCRCSVLRWYGTAFRRWWAWWQGLTLLHLSAPPEPSLSLKSPRERRLRVYKEAPFRPGPREGETLPRVQGGTRLSLWAPSETTKLITQPVLAASRRADECKSLPGGGHRAAARQRVGRGVIENSHSTGVGSAFESTSLYEVSH